MPPGETLCLPTPVGQAEAHVDLSAAARLLVVLGHGAGGGPEAPDLLAVRDALVPAGIAVARVTQPYRVLGRRAPAPSAQLDVAWVAVVAALRTRARLVDLPLVVGGRSSGARVACRTAADVCAQSVVALSFPLIPSWRPERDRREELRTVAVPLLVVQGERDAFGTPEQIAAAAPLAQLHAVRGADHAFGVRRQDGRRQAAGAGRGGRRGPGLAHPAQLTIPSYPAG